MSALSNDFSAVGLDLISEFGESVTFTRINPGSFIANDGSVVEAANSTYTAYAFQTQFVGIARYLKYSEADRSTIKVGDIKLFIEAESGYAPRIGDTCVLQGTTYRIMDIMQAMVNGVVALYTCQLRS